MQIEHYDDHDGIWMDNADQQLEFTWIFTRQHSGSVL